MSDNNSRSRRRGVKASDIPPEKLEQLLKEGYSISPRSGRLRKRIKGKSHDSEITKKKIEKNIFLINC